MRNLELSIEREIEFMIKHQLTADELFLIKLIWYAQDHHPEFIQDFFSQNSLGKPIRELLLSLQEKEVLTKAYTVPKVGEVFNPDDVIFNKLLIKSFLQHSQELGMELFEAYPAFTTINGKVMSLRNITKLYHSLDEMCWAYGKEIKFNLELHRKILDLIEYAKENNLIHNGICAFISEHQWEMLEKVQDGGQDFFNTNQML